MRVKFYDVEEAVKNILPSVNLIKVGLDAKNKLRSSTCSIPVVLKEFGNVYQHFWSVVNQ